MLSVIFDDAPAAHFNCRNSQNLWARLWIFSFLLDLLDTVLCDFYLLLKKQLDEKFSIKLS